MKDDHIDFEALANEIMPFMADKNFNGEERRKFIINQMKAAIEKDRMSRWIPVSERSPEDGQTVFIYCYDYINVAQFEDGNFIEHNEENPDVISWHPTPTKPKPE